MSVLEARSPGRSLRFRCPGGRIGAKRFEAFLDLVDDVSDLTLMVSRRQALVVRGALGDVPNYLYQELSADELSGPNVKSYPYSSFESLQDYVIDRLGVLSANTSAITFSYSADRLYRGNLRLDDFCLSKRSAERFTLESRLWSADPRTLLEDVPLRELPVLFEALEQVLTEVPDRRELCDRSFRDVRKKLFSAYNHAEIGDPPGLSLAENDSGDVLCERTFLKSSVDGTFSGQGDEGTWVILPVVAGILSESTTRCLRSILEECNVRAMRLTPEQNILLPVENQSQAREIARGIRGDLETVPQDDFFPRVSTCPGSIFCSNVKTKPVELARKLAASCRTNRELLEFNHLHPIGVTGCGETRSLERRHPVGIYPLSAGNYGLSLGGSLHGDGRQGVELPNSYSAQSLLTIIKRIAGAFLESSRSDFDEWCLRVDLSEFS